MAKIIKPNKKRRFCKLSSCRRLLSIYNSSPYCHAHNHLALSGQPVSASAAYSRA